MMRGCGCLLSTYTVSASHLLCPMVASCVVCCWSLLYQPEPPPSEDSLMCHLLLAYGTLFATCAHYVHYLSLGFARSAASLLCCLLLGFGTLLPWPQPFPSFWQSPVSVKLVSFVLVLSGDNAFLHPHWHQKIYSSSLLWIHKFHGDDTTLWVTIPGEHPVGPRLL